MPLRVKCAGCGQVLEAPDSLAGKKARCQNCGAVIELPPASFFESPEQVAGPQRPVSTAAGKPSVLVRRRKRRCLKHPSRSIFTQFCRGRSQLESQGWGSYWLRCDTRVARRLAHFFSLVAVSLLRSWLRLRQGTWDSTAEESTASSDEMAVGTARPAQSRIRV